MSAALLAVMILSAAPVPAGSSMDWPQWRGVNRDGKSTETGLSIPKDGPPLTWKNDSVGIGYGSPAVVGDRIYLIGGEANPAGSPEFLLCLSSVDGKEIWRKSLGTSAGKFLDGWGGGPRSTPSVHGEHVFVLGGTGDLVCFATSDGAIVWRKNLVRDFGGEIPKWGYAESPLFDDDKILVTPGKAVSIVALEAKTGKTVWQCKEFKDEPGYSSIMPMVLDGKKLYIQQSANHSFGVFAQDGKLAFKAGAISRRTAVIPTPVISGDYVFYTAGYSAGSEAFKLSVGGSAVDARALYTDKVMSNHHGGVIAIDDHIYGHSNGSQGWVCMTFKTAKPEIVWNNAKFGKGSISYADGHFYCYQESNGELAIIKASPEKWNEVARMKLPATSSKRPNQGRVWPHPVIAQGKLFLRDYELLFAFDMKTSK